MTALLDIGKQCAACDTVDFLPLYCQHCSKPFCSSHIHTHSCTHAASSRLHATASRFEGPKIASCDLEGCHEATLESASDVGGSEVAHGLRCPGCAGAYCVMHRAQDSHNCTAPRIRDEYHIAAAERKALARQRIATAFPELAGRTIPKPAPARDIAREPPSHTASAAIPVHSASDPVPAPQYKAPSSRAEKLRALSLRKLRSLAKPVDPRGSDLPVEERLYFTWEVDEAGLSLTEWHTGATIEKEEAIGKCMGGKAKAEARWTRKDMSAGRVLELLAKEARLSNEHSAADPIKNLGLVALLNPPLDPNSYPQKVVQLDLSVPLSFQVEDCSRIVVLRGPLTSL